MRYWLMWSSIHGTEIRRDHIGTLWPYDKVRPNEHVKEGHFVYLIRNRGEVYSFGYVSRIEAYRDQGKELWRVYVSRQDISHEMIPAEKLREHPVLSRLYKNMDASLIPLTVDDAKSINQLLRSGGVRPPSDPVEEDLPIIVNVQAPVSEPEMNFILNRPVSVEETLVTEFKAVVGGNPVDSIKNKADEYAVAFLNIVTGRVLWGVRDSDRVVVGVCLNAAKKDEIRREVSKKLGEIQPYFPQDLITQNFYPVCDEDGQELSDLWVYELRVPKGQPSELYATGGHDVYVKTEGGKYKLGHIQRQAEFERRRRLPQSETSDPSDKAEARTSTLSEKAATPEVGNPIIQSWFSDVINPLLRALEGERELLEQKKLTWEVPPGHFKSIRPIKKYVFPFTDTLDQLLEHYPMLKVMVVIREQQMGLLLATCIHLQDSLEKEEQLRKIYLQAKADDSMTRQGEPLNKVFNVDSEQEHLTGITQCIVNQSDEMPSHFVYYAVWNKYRDDLLALLNLPLIRMQNETVRSGVEGFLDTTQHLIRLLKETRSQLSLKYNVPLKS